MIKVPVNKSECCGCSGCVDICSVDAISMRTDEEGFLYPYIDEKICINCGVCGKVCAFFNSISHKTTRKESICYVAKHNEEKVRMNSRSGGVFVSCSDMILAQNGTVYGCILDDELKAVHSRAETSEERNKMCRSKYVQSDMRNIFELVKTDLQNERAVLFSGTGCQVDAILSYLKFKKIDTTKLYTIDIVCHGCVSPMIYKDYLSFIEKKYNGKVQSFEFRDKNVCGWDGHKESFVINQKKYTSVSYRDIFISTLPIRPSCYNCKYSNISHSSDITIGDAWGIKRALPEFNDNRGVSLILVNSNKGEKLLRCIEEHCCVAKLPLEKMMQPNLYEPTKLNGDREQFWEDYRIGGIESIVKKYGTPPLKKRVKSWFKYKLKQIVKGKKYYLP